MTPAIEQIPPFPPLLKGGEGGFVCQRGGEACLRQAKRLPVRCTCLPSRGDRQAQTGGRQGGFRQAGGLSEQHWSQRP